MNLPLFVQVIWMFLIPLIVVIVPVLMGQRYGILHHRTMAAIPHDSIASVVSAAFGLLAFMLAFTFQIAANRYDSRKTLLLQEVTEIRTAYLRAGLIPEPYRSTTKKQLLEYVDLRVQLAMDRSKLEYTLASSQRILDSLWAHTEALAVLDRSSEVYALYTSSINDVVSAYNERIATGLVYRIPSAVLLVLFILVVLSMLSLGYQFGVSGTGSIKINLLLALIFAVVMFLIFALDRPETGLVPINQKPLLSLQQQLQQKQLHETATGP